MIDEDSRQTSAYSDPLYLPFYYHLASAVQATSVLTIGLRLGLATCCFLKGSSAVERVLAIQEPSDNTFYSPRMAKANLKESFKGDPYVHHGLITDAKFIDSMNSSKWDVALIDEEKPYDRHMAYLDAVWERMNNDGYIVMDYLTSHAPASKAFFDFARTRNREPVLISTRYGVGIIQR
jgi:predicted O-methyltransferase YrrM